ncbi:MAG: hypothetical protein IKM31_05455 [Oscillospiraceae bacterium]|nr:hypothetical protein [Oscillospiraceae bacterium]
MKAYIFQPAYSMDFADSDALLQWELDQLDNCGEDADLIVLPEYSNVPCLAKTREQMEESYHKYSDKLLSKAADTARRCSATVFVNCIYPTPTGLRNTTVAFSKTGEIAGCYYKQHLVPSEMNVYELDTDYTWEYSEPTILEVDGVRYAFLICYDVYFYEIYANIARYDPDVVVICAYQRSDSHDALEMMCKFCSYNTNAYVVRSSVSLGADSPVGGTSMVTAPDGSVLLNMMNEVGVGTAEFDPHARHLKPAGFGNPPAPHHNYIEAGRRPWKYRPGGSAIVRHDDIMTYPRVCAHRGFSTIAPENSMPAFGAAVALGAEEIEFDLWSSKDGVIVSIHDSNLERVSDGSGYVWEHTYEELLKFDFGAKHGPEFEGLKIPSFEDILKKFACHVVMNVHVKAVDDVNPLPEETVREIVRLINKYDCRKYCYIMSGNIAILEQFRAIAPDIARCAGADIEKPLEDLVDKAIATGSKKIQLFKPFFKYNDPDYVRRSIEKAHQNGIICNLFWSDDPAETLEYLEMGMDVILANDYQRVAAAVKKFREKN